MKKIIMYIIIGFIICAAFMPAVTRSVQGQAGNKPSFKLTDYRDVYMGNYFCNCSCRATVSDKSGQGNFTDTATISVVKDALDSILQVNIALNTYKMKLTNSKMRPCQAGTHFSGNFFASDSISFVMYIGLGHVCRYQGKKR